MWEWKESHKTGRGMKVTHNLSFYGPERNPFLPTPTLLFHWGKKKQKDIYHPGNNVNCYIVWHSFVCCAKSLQCIQLFVTPWTVAHQAPLSMGFSRKEYWRGLPFPPPGDLPNPGIEPWSLLSPQLAGGFFTTSTKSVVGEKKFYPRYISRIYPD